MLQQIYPDMSRAERKVAMKNAAYKVEYGDYQAPLPADELSAENDAYSQKAIELAGIKADFAAYKKKKAAEIKAVEEEMAVALEVIKSGKREIEGNLYLFQDLQKNDMNYFDVNGMWIRTRKIRPEERQTTIHIGLSDVDGGQPTDDDIEDTDTEDASAVDVSNESPGLGDNVSMPSEYEAMDGGNRKETAAEELERKEAEAGIVNHNETVDTIDEEGDVNRSESIDYGTDNKQQEAEEKLAAHKANKKRLTKKEKEQAALANALIPKEETTHDEDDFNLPD